MRYAQSEFGFPPVGIEPQPRDNPKIATVEISDYEFQSVITICDKPQLQEVVNLLRDASRINGWGELK